MFGLIRVIGSYLYLWLHRVRGESILTEIPIIRDTSSLTAFSLDGYDITIHANRRDYERRYVRRLVQPKRHSVYLVFSVVSNDAPEYLKEVCSLQVHLPPLLPPFMSDRSQREAAIHAYVDLLIARARLKKVRNS